MITWIENINKIPPQIPKIQIGKPREKKAPKCQFKENMKSDIRAKVNMKSNAGKSFT